MLRNILIASVVGVSCVGCATGPQGAHAGMTPEQFEALANQVLAESLRLGSNVQRIEDGTIYLRTPSPECVDPPDPARTALELTADALRLFQQKSAKIRIGCMPPPPHLTPAAKP